MKHFIMWLLLTLFLSVSSFSQKPANINITKKPIAYNAERIQLSLEYLKERHNLSQTYPVIAPRIIVLHYTSGGNFKSTLNYFNNVTIENSRKYNKTQSQLNVSAHYVVDRNGAIYNLIEDTLFARHTIGLNYCAIGIENIGSKSQPLTDAQVKANADLIRYLKSKYAIEYVIGHSEYGKFRQSKLWRETNSNYFTYKDDPGDVFLAKVRSLIEDLNLKKEP